MSRSAKTLALVAVLLTLAVVPLVRWWLRPPVVAQRNLRYLPLLRTAISARNAQWLDGVNRAVDQQHSAGALGDDERRHFEKIIATARDGDWARADRLALGFEAAQSGRTREGGSAVDCCAE